MALSNVIISNRFILEEKKNLLIHSRLPQRSSLEGMTQKKHNINGNKTLKQLLMNWVMIWPKHSDAYVITLLSRVNDVNEIRKQ